MRSAVHTVVLGCTPTQYFSWSPLKLSRSRCCCRSRNWPARHPPARPQLSRRESRSSAICGLVAKPISAGTPAFSRRALSTAHSSGRYSRKAIGRLPRCEASDRLTATWQLSCSPSCPQYWRDTPTEWRPFFGKPVSSTIHKQPSSSFRAGIAHSRTPPSTASSDQSDFATMWCSDWCFALTCHGSLWAASGSTLLRSIGSISARLYSTKPARRSACPSFAQSCSMYRSNSAKLAMSPQLACQVLAIMP